MIRILKKYWKWWSTLLLVFFFYFIFCLPRTLFDTPYSVVIEDQELNLLGALIADDGQWRFPQSEKVPILFETALIEFEDRRFYRHPGLDVLALFRAIQQNIRNGRIVSGGSTLTMQVIRLARQNPRRTILNKLREMVMALRLELSYTKEEILLMYCAHAPFGGNVVGLDAAAWRYYGKSAELLSWSEAATLAVLPNSPGLIHPGRNRAALEAKRNRLLQRLFDAQKIDEVELELAQEETLPDRPLPLPQHVPHLLQRLAQDYRNGKVKQPRVQSTIDLALQTAVNQRMKQYQRQMAKNEIHNAAALILHIPSNTMLAYVGNAPGAGAEHGEMVDVIRAPRSTGSILKPFLYSMALEAGTILPRSLLSDTPVNFNGYRPENYKQDYSGAVPADEALARSLNIPFVNLL
ncbi:MAG: transglycosylase domain-containing protein, partial [Bacteroidota bacterium]